MTVPFPSFPSSARALTRHLPPIEAISRLARTASFEIGSGGLAEFDHARAWLPPGATISITSTRTDTADDRVAMAKALIEAGFDALPHVSARRLASEHDGEALIGRLRDEAGVTQLFLVGGDAPEPVGPFDAALSLVGRFRLASRGIQRVGFAAYPEAHPLIDAEILDCALDTKIAVSEDAGLEPFVTTQFTFAPAPILNWLSRARARGIVAPVHIGVAGPASISALLRYARLCGVGPSARSLVSNGASIARMLQETAPDPVIRGLGEAAESRDLEHTSLHIYPFGGLERAARWISAVALGQFHLRESGTGFDLAA